MILVGNQRANASDLAVHLMREDNEAVVLYELRGFVGEDLHSAFRESQAISRATRCRQHLYSLSLNPPPGKSLDPDAFLEAIERAEAKLGLTGQPRAVVFHEKRGSDGELRRHAHAVWCRIDTEAMKAIPLPHTRHKLQDLARELYVEHDWQMPAGFVRHADADPRNYSLAEWQQAKRAGKDPRVLKEKIQEAWAISDSQGALTQALRERGLILARGDRRGVVAVDAEGDVYALLRWVGIKAKRVRERVVEPDKLPDVSQAKAEAATLIAERVKALHADQVQDALDDTAQFMRETSKLRDTQETDRQRLAIEQERRRREEAARHAARFRRGWRGLLDRLTGQHARTKAQNQAEITQSAETERIEASTLAAQQSIEQKALAKQYAQIRAGRSEAIAELEHDLQRLDQAGGDQSQSAPEHSHDPPPTGRRQRRRQTRRLEH
ncbi:MAG: relaxase [Pseudomonadota bacterium]